jgi:hypothetical protein
MCRAFDSLEAIDLVVRGLRFALPWSQAEDALHRVKRGLNEAVQIPDLVGALRCGDPELQAYGETGILWLHACDCNRCPD